MIKKTEALVLKSIPFHETSSIVHLYTKEYGKVPIIAKGARRLKSQFSGYLEPLNYIEVIYYEKSTRDIQTLSKVDLIQTFFRGYADIKILSLATAVVESIDKFVKVTEQDENLFNLAINTLKFMDRNRALSWEAFIYFMLKFCQLLGYKLEVKTCPKCGHKIGRGVYDTSSGKIVCERCGFYYENGFLINSNRVEYFAKLEDSDLSKDLLAVDSKSVAVELINLLLLHLSIHLDTAARLKSLEIAFEK